MSSIVQFTGENVALKVREDVEAVLETWRESHGRPFRLEYFKGGDVYINPALIAFVRTASKAGVVSL